MAANDQLYARVPQPSDLSVKNTTGGATAIAIYKCVKLDATNPVSITNPYPGVVVTTTDDKYFGVTIEAIADTKVGRVANFGSIVPCIAGAAITAGALVQCDTVGNVKTLGAGKPQVGQALTAAAALNDIILVRLHSPAVNA